MKKLFVVALLSAFIAVGLSLAVMQGQAAFQTISSGQVHNAGLQQYFTDVRGYKMVSAVAGTAADGATTTVTGMEAGDVIMDVVNLGATMTSISAGTVPINVDESGYTAASGGAVLDTSISEPTAGDNLIFIFADINNTN